MLEIAKREAIKISHGHCAFIYRLLHFLEWESICLLLLVNVVAVGISCALSQGKFRLAFLPGESDQAVISVTCFWCYNSCAKCLRGFSLCYSSKGPRSSTVDENCFQAWRTKLSLFGRSVRKRFLPLRNLTINGLYRQIGRASCRERV